MTEKQIIRKCPKCGDKFEQPAKHSYEQGTYFAYCPKCRKPKQAERRALNKCLWCNRQLTKNIDGFCNELHKLSWEIIFRRLINLKIDEPTKTEIIALWRKGQIHPIIEKLEAEI
jgi:hypothetical protein